MWGELFIPRHACSWAPHELHMAAGSPGSHRGGNSCNLQGTENLGSSALAGHHTKLLVGVGLAEHWTGSLLSLKL